MKIQFSDIVSLLAVTISILTFTISLYVQFGKPPKLITTIGEDLRLYYLKNGHLVLRSNLSFFNLGARYLGVRKVVGVITRKSDGLSMNFQWSDFFKVTSISSSGKSQKPWTEFDGPLQTIIVAGYQGVNKSITFITDRPFEITQGVYSLEYTAYTIPAFKRPAKTYYSIRIEKDDSEYLSKKCTANDKGVMRILLN